MPIELFCPTCRARLRVDDEQLGQAVECPKCRHRFDPADRLARASDSPPAALIPPPMPTAPLSPLALAAFILCLIPITYPLGAILAIAALFTTRRGRQRGMGLAVGGLVGGLLIPAMLVAIMLPMLSQARNHARQHQCAAILRGLGTTFKIYQQENNDLMPALLQGRNYDGTPMAVPDGIDTENSLWLMVSSGKASPDVFVCRSDTGAAAVRYTGDRFDGGLAFPRVRADGTIDPAGPKRSNSYSYQVPNGGVGNPGTPNNNNTRFAILADRGPFNADLHILPGGSIGASDPLADARKYLRDNPRLAEKINSPNHAGRGQNVLFQDGHVKWHTDPWCGIDNDNIYTRATGPAARDRIIGAKCGVTQLPYDDDDSVLLSIDKGVYRTGP